MAEIKRFQSDFVYNKPIGVVTPSRAGIAAAETLSQVGAQLANLGYDRAVKEETIAGKRAAMRMRTRDADGNLSYTDVSSELSPIAARTAEAKYDERYLVAMGNDLKMRFASLASDYAFDPQGFDERSGTFLQETVATVDEKFKGYAEELGASLIFEHYNEISIDARKRADMIANENTQRLFEDEITDASAYVADQTLTAIDNVIEGDFQSPEEYQAAVNDMFSVVDGNIRAYSDKIYSWAISTGKQEYIDQARTMVDRYRTAAGRGYANGVLSIIDRIPVNAENARMKMQFKNEVIDGMQYVFRTGNMPTDISEGAKQILQGFNIQGVVRELGSVTSTNIASDLATISNNTAKLIADDIARANAGVTINNITNAPADKVQEALAVTYGIETPQQMLSLLNSLLTTTPDGQPTFQSHPVTQMIQQGAGNLPASFKGIFNNESMFNALVGDPATYPLMRSLYDQSTQRTTSTGTVFLPRGFSAEVVAKMAQLKVIERFNPAGSVADFWRQSTDPTVDFSARGQTILESQKTTIPKLVDKHIDEDNLELIGYANKNLQSMIGAYGLDTSIEMLKEMGKNYDTSDLMFNQPLTLYTPERVYGDDFDIWLSAATAKLSIANSNPVTGEAYKLGEDAFLVLRPDRDPNLPEYFAVDSTTGRIITSAHTGGPVIITGQSVFAARRIRLQQELQNSLDNAPSLEDQKAIEDQRAADEEFAAGVGEVAIPEHTGEKFNEFFRGLGFGQPVTQGMISEDE